MIYFYDGTKEAFLTALALSFHDGEPFLTSGNKQLVLGQESVFVRTDVARAKKIEARLLSFDKDCMGDLDTILRSGEPNKDNIALAYFRLIAEKKRPVRMMLSEDAALAADECMRRVGFEIHRFHGFVRFLATASGALYAPISPDNDICDLLVPHFRARMPKIPFVIHDVKRKKAAVYDGENTFLAPLGEAEVVLAADEMQWQNLWKKYYNSVNIPSRERLKQMRGYMPVRYWKFMPEKQQRPDDGEGDQGAPSPPSKRRK